MNKQSDRMLWVRLVLAGLGSILMFIGGTAAWFYVLDQRYVGQSDLGWGWQVFIVGAVLTIAFAALRPRDKDL